MKKHKLDLELILPSEGAGCDRLAGSGALRSPREFGRPVVSHISRVVREVVEEGDDLERQLCLSVFAERTRPLEDGGNLGGHHDDSRRSA